MHHLNAVADVFETSCGSLKLLLDNGHAGSCIQGPTLDDAGQNASRRLPLISSKPVCGPQAFTGDLLKGAAEFRDERMKFLEVLLVSGFWPAFPNLPGGN